MKARSPKKDKLASTRESIANKKYSTTEIRNLLTAERELYVEYEKDPDIGKAIAMIDYWIAEFKKYPEIDNFMLPSGNDLVDVLQNNKSMIEHRAYSKKRRGQDLKYVEELRSKRITVFISDSELKILESLATQEKMPIAKLLREKGLSHKLALKPMKLDLKAYGELGHASANLNQIARHLNTNPEFTADIDAIQVDLKMFRQSLISMKNEDGDDEG